MTQEEIVWRGKWWVSGSQRMDGTMRFNHNKEIILELDWVFNENEIYYEIILGESQNNEKITVVDAKMDSQVIFPNSGNEIRKFSCNLALIGMHANKFSDIKFEKVYLTPTYITEWMLPSQTFSEILYKPIPKYENGEIIYNVNAKKIEHVVKISPLNSKLIFNLELRHFGDHKVTCEFKYIAYLIIEPDVKKDLNWFLDINTGLCNFLTLITNQTVYSDRMSGVIEKHKVNIYFKNFEPFIPKNISIYDIDIKFSDLGYFRGNDYLETCINNWFEKEESLGPVYELFHMVKYVPFIYKKTCFLTLMQALEAFYEQKYKEHKYLKKSEWNPIRDGLIRAIPFGLIEDLEESIKNKINYGNTYSLKTKMNRLLNERHLIYIRGAYGGFGEDKIKKICDTRDYLTHHMDDYAEKILKEPELDEVNEILKISLIVLILDEIGVPSEIISKILERKIKWLKYYYKA
jgi:hypothetical protein